jgi:hypothetical protein
VWDRGEAKPEVEPRKIAVAVRPVVNIDAASLLSRYQDGAHEAVWRDLLSLGPDVRRAPYLDVHIREWLKGGDSLEDGNWSKRSGRAADRVLSRD